MEKLRTEDQRRKRTMVFNRISGILVSIAIFALLLCFYFKIVDDWVVSITTIMLSAINFIICATLTEIEGKNSVNSINLLFSVIFFIMGIGIMVYGILTKNLVVPFVN